MRILGIDPGLSGALAIIERADGDLFGTSSADRIVDVIDVPAYGIDAQRRVNGPVIQKWIRAHAPNSAFVELAGPRPHDGAWLAFRYGRAVGAIEDAILCSGLSIQHVTPQVWKKFFGLRGPDKELSRQCAIHRMPAAIDMIPAKKHHGRAEAMLIALYGLMRIAAEHRGRSAA